MDLGHVTEATSTAAMILVRFATLWLAFLVGFFALSILKKKHPGLLAESDARKPVAETDA
mgnify:CR=1 FL=1